MNAVNILQTALSSTQYILKTYLSDFSDEDMLVRPVPSAHHAAWQTGHLIVAETNLLRMAVPNASVIDFPEGFAEKHGKDKGGENAPSAFLTRAEYLDLFDRVRKGTIETVGGLSESDLDTPTEGPMATFAPTTGAMLVLISNHTLMHAGQFAVIRRVLGKPILI